MSRDKLSLKEIKTELSLKSTPEIRAKIHQHHFVRFRGEVGDIVYFERGKNRGKKADKIPWRVAHVEADPEKAIWTNGGKVPLYIKLVGCPNGKEEMTVHTCEKFLVNQGGKTP